MARRADGRLRAFLDLHSPTQVTLPLIHITRAYSFDEMLLVEQLEPIKGEDGFDEPLIYLFYGRPAYRAKRGNNARLEFEWPIVFLFDPEKIQNILRIYPFDTGAFFLKFYEQFFDPSAQVDDFALKPTLESIGRLVSAFYTSNKEYFDGATRKNVQLEKRQFEAQGLLELARLPGIQGARSGYHDRDERSSAVEVQVSKPIPFRETLLGVVLPETYLDDDEIRRALSRWNVKEIETYGTVHNTSGEVWVGQVYQVVRKLYERLNLFK